MRDIYSGKKTFILLKGSFIPYKQYVSANFSAFGSRANKETE